MAQVGDKLGCDSGVKALKESWAVQDTSPWQQVEERYMPHRRRARPWKKQGFQQKRERGKVFKQPWGVKKAITPTSNAKTNNPGSADLRE